MSSGIDVAGAHVSFSGSIKLLSVELDSVLSMDGHVSNVVRGCNYHIRALRHIRPLLDLNTAKMLAQGIVHYRCRPARLLQQLDVWCVQPEFQAASGDAKCSRQGIVEHNALARAFCVTIFV